ncbi:Hypothetical Protein FCC1311_077672 [Hondaea fermentalgiana]|uniref:Uncharacterized protein n=1 Tax=Hondaea fermentalgiana TaxID=2315210 RepID=A0A2R5GSC2_9STRA|nr:Hypothetical Protein FCC1311_077672 [Hondaea fermentalgiana]|eukprot:GBG31543.1 Hypothetical Protein FCC1311_077672 [Hondaea fermentalgiana]
MAEARSGQEDTKPAATESTKEDTAASSEGGLDMEELLVHIKGLKFQHPEYGTARIHREIQALGGVYEKLNQQKLRKIMKKHGLLSSQLEEDNRKAGVIQMYTVGDASKPHVHAKLPPEAQAQNENQGTEPEGGRWLPVELGVPGDRSGTKMHQAVIKMRRDVAKRDDPSATAAVPGAMICKVQVAIGAPEDSPMLLYDKDRRKQTFLHPDMPGFAEVRAQVLKCTAEQGPEVGAKGPKAFFYAKQTRQTGKQFLLINVQEPAPWQTW